MAKILSVAALILAIGCARKTEVLKDTKNNDVRKEMMVMGPVILPNSMCAAHGTTAYSNDKEGERMVCELQNQLGTHIPRCVCVDEGFSERERQLAFEQLRNLGIINPCGGAAITQCNGSTALGTRF